MTTFANPNGQRNPQRAAAEQKIERWCWAILAAIIFEGALRKWFLPPALQTVAYLAKYAIAFAFILKHPFKPINTPLRNGLTALLGLSFLLLPSLMVGFQAYPVAAMMTLTNAVLWPVFAFHLANRLTPGIAGRLTAKLAFVAIGMSILSTAQFASPPSSLLNKYAWNSLGLNDEAITFGTSSGVRATGTFSFITGLGTFALFCFALFMYQYLAGRSIKERLLALCGAIACIVCIFASGSRGPLVFCAACVVLVLVIARRLKTLMSLVALGAVCAACLSFLPDNPLVAAYAGRAENSSDTFEERAITPLTEFIDQLGDTPFGDGLGQHSQLVTLNASQQNGSGIMVSREDARARAASESGFLGVACLFGTILVLANYFFKALGTNTARTKIATGAIGPIVLIDMFGCLWYDHVASSFCWFTAAVWLSTLAERPHGADLNPNSYSRRLQEQPPLARK